MKRYLEDDWRDPEYEPGPVAAAIWMLAFVLIVGTCGLVFAGLVAWLGGWRP